MTEIRLYVAGYPDSDHEDRAQLTGGLQQELHDLDVDDVWSHSGPAPVGTKGSPLEWAVLVVSLAGGLPPVVAALHGWLGRHPGTSITVEIDDDRLELSDALASERYELIAAWMARHTASLGPPQAPSTGRRPEGPPAGEPDDDPGADLPP